MRVRHNKYKALTWQTKQHFSPFGVIIGIWTVGLTLGLYFANDISLADGDEGNSYPTSVASLGDHLTVWANRLNISSLQKRSSKHIQSFYDSHATLGDRVPPAPWQDNTTLGVSDPDEIFFPEDCHEALPEPTIPKNILIVGSSSMYGTMGITLEKHLSNEANLTVLRHAKSGTGLARPDVYNWLDVSTQLASEHRADLVIAQFIGNDCQSLITPDKTVEARRKDDTWNAAYHGRVTAFVEAHQARGAEVVLIGMPIVRSGVFRKRLHNANNIVKEVAKETGAAYISVWEKTADENGKYTEELRLSSKTIKLRHDDGIHLSYRGAKVIAKYLFDELQNIYPWGQESQPDSTLAATTTESTTEPLAPEIETLVTTHQPLSENSKLTEDTGERLTSEDDSLD